MTAEKKRPGRPVGQFAQKAQQLYEYLFAKQEYGYVDLTDDELGEALGCCGKQISRYLHWLKGQGLVYWKTRRYQNTPKSWFNKRYIRFGSEPKE
jgi:CRP-like cAMP-binding protein